MEKGIEKINRILINLSSTQEDMLALKDYIWQNLDHSSVEEVQTAASFQVKYLELLDQFAQNSQEISALISQFTGIKVEDSPKEVEQSNSENQRIIKELNKDEKRVLNTLFTGLRGTTRNEMLMTLYAAKPEADGSVDSQFIHEIINGLIVKIYNASID